MHKIDADGNIAGEFSDGDEGLGILGTKVDAAWLNAVQEEIVNLLLDMGVVLAKGTNTQLSTAFEADTRRARAWLCATCVSDTLTTREETGIASVAKNGTPTDGIVVTLDEELVGNYFSVVGNVWNDQGWLWSADGRSGPNGGYGPGAYFTIKFFTAAGVQVADISGASIKVDLAIYGTLA